MHCYEIDWTTLKAIFSIFRFFLPSDSRFSFLLLSYHSNPYINGKLINSASRRCINLNFEKLTVKTGFVVQGHIWTRFSSKESCESSSPWLMLCDVRIVYFWTLTWSSLACSTSSSAAKCSPVIPIISMLIML